MLVGDAYMYFEFETRQQRKRAGWCNTVIWIHSLNHDMGRQSTTYIGTGDGENVIWSHWISGYTLWEGYHNQWFQFLPIDDSPDLQRPVNFVWKACKTPLPRQAIKLSNSSRFSMLHPRWRRISRKTRKGLQNAAALPLPLVHVLCDWVSERV